MQCFFSDIVDNNDNSERKFYIDMIVKGISSLSDEKLRDMAETVIKIIGMIK